MNTECAAMDLYDDNCTCKVISPGVVHCNDTVYHEHTVLDYHDEWFWIYLGCYVGMVLFAGLMSGLTLGLLSLDMNSLNILQMAGTNKEKKQARRIAPIIKHHHLLLVTLLLCNAVAVESMPLFMDKISNEITAIVVSVTAVLFFGEVAPQAVCSRYGLAIGANLAPLVYFLMGLFFLISWPIAKLLDCVLGKDHRTFFRRAEIKALVDLHGPEGTHVEDPLSYDEVLIIKGAMEMRDKVASDAMVPIQSVFMLDVNSKLDKTTVDKILKAAHSRIPIYEGSKQNILGILLVKVILAINPADATPLREIIKNKNSFRQLSFVSASTPLYDLLNEFQKGKGHLAAVLAPEPDDDSVDVTVNGLQPSTTQTQAGDKVHKESPTSDIGASEASSTPHSVFINPQQTVSGIITLEDVIEELLCEEIVDETDVYIDVHKRLLVARARASAMGYPVGGIPGVPRGKSVPVDRQVASAAGVVRTRPTTTGLNETQRPLSTGVQGGRNQPMRSQVSDGYSYEDDPHSPLIP